MEQKKSLYVALIFNIVIVLCEICAIVLDIAFRDGYNILERIQFYTIDSNMFLLISSILFIVFAVVSLKKNKVIPKFVSILRFFSTICVFITFFVVVTILIPMGADAVNVLFGRHLFFYHVLCPILSVVSFIFFEKDKRFTKEDVAYSVIPSLLYAVVLLVLNILKVVVGPYPFLLVYVQPVWASIVWTVGFLIGFVVLGFIMRKLNQIGLKEVDERTT